MSIGIMCAVVIAIAISTAITIVGALTKQRRWYLLAKPLTMTLIIVLAVERNAAADHRYWLFAALLLSLLGDILLMFPARWFLVGLVAFLFTHLAYIGLFISLSGLWWHPVVLPLLMAAMIYWVQLAPYKPRLMPAIVVYTTALVLMCTTALALAFGDSNYGLMVGVLLFAFSDSVLGWNKFARSIPRAQLWILGSYFTAQTLIVWSL